jgi:hypothetical protein
MASSGKRGCPYCVSEEYQDLGEYAGYAPPAEVYIKINKVIVDGEKKYEERTF